MYALSLLTASTFYISFIAENVHVQEQQDQTKAEFLHS